MNMLLGISLDVGQENLATIQGAGGEVEAGVELGGGAVIFFEDFGGCGFFVVDPLELFFQDLLVFVFGNVIFRSFQSWFRQVSAVVYISSANSFIFC